MRKKIAGGLSALLAVSVLTGVALSPCAEASKVSKHDLGQAQKSYQAGIQQYNSNNPKSAAENFIAATKSDEKNPLYSLFAADMLRELKQYPSSIRYYQTTIKNVSHAEKDMREKIKIKAMTGLANAYADSGDRENGITYANKVIHEFPDDYRGYFALGTIYNKDKATYDEAIKAYKDSLNASKDQYNSYVRLIRIYMEKNDIQGIIDTYKMGVDYRPLDEGMKMALAQVYIQHKDKNTNKNYYPEAIEVLKSLENLNPKNDLAHYYLSMLYALTDDKDNAKKELAILANVNGNLAHHLDMELQAYDHMHAGDKKVSTNVDVDPETGRTKINVDSTIQGEVKDEISLDDDEAKDKGETKTPLDKSKESAQSALSHSGTNPAERESKLTKQERNLIRSQLDKLEKNVK